MPSTTSEFVYLCQGSFPDLQMSPNTEHMQDCDVKSLQKRCLGLLHLSHIATFIQLSLDHPCLPFSRQTYNVKGDTVSFTCKISCIQSTTTPLCLLPPALQAASPNSSWDYSPAQLVPFLAPTHPSPVQLSLSREATMVLLYHRR